MLTWILVVLALYLVQIFLVVILRFSGPDKPSKEMMVIGAGPRDEQPELSVIGGRADRALTNLKESLPFFLTFALLAIFQNNTSEAAVLGATAYAIARIVYVPVYLSGIPGLRSVVWVISVSGLISMLISIL